MHKGAVKGCEWPSALSWEEESQVRGKTDCAASDMTKYEKTTCLKSNQRWFKILEQESKSFFHSLDKYLLSTTKCFILFKCLK